MPRKRTTPKQPQDEQTEPHDIRIVIDADTPASWDEMTEQQKDASVQALVDLARVLMQPDPDAVSGDERTAEP